MLLWGEVGGRDTHYVRWVWVGGGRGRESSKTASREGGAAGHRLCARGGGMPFWGELSMFCTEDGVEGPTNKRDVAQGYNRGN